MTERNHQSRTDKSCWNAAEMAEDLQVEADFFAPFKNACRSGKFSILEEDAQGILIFNPDNGIAMICHRQPVFAIRWLKKHQTFCRNYPLLVCLQENLCRAIRKQYPERVIEPCIQVLWTSASCAPAADIPDLKIEPAAEDEFSTIAEHYELIGKKELKQDLQERRIFTAKVGGELAGFAGIHSEGAMGMLEVLPKWRHRGIAGQLEAAAALKMQKMLLIPYAHIFKNNHRSLALQKKLHLQFCEKPVYWIIDPKTDEASQQAMIEHAEW